MDKNHYNKEHLHKHTEEPASHYCIMARDKLIRFKIVSAIVFIHQAVKDIMDSLTGSNIALTDGMQEWKY
jgi:hypothetical protein